MTLRTQTQFLIPHNHPSLDGHFPGSPIVPGVVVLDAVFAAARVAFNVASMTGIEQVKFLAPLLPDETANIGIELEDSRVRFSVNRGEDVIARGALRVAMTSLAP